jgi:hypothetical protein
MNKVCMLKISNKGAKGFRIDSVPKKKVGVDVSR